MSVVRTDRHVALGAALLAGAAGGMRLGAPSVWHDEAASFLNATATLPELLALSAQSEASGSLHALLLHPWTALGTSEWLLRLPSLAFAVATVPVFFLLARELCDRLTARVAVVLLAVSPLLLTWARQVRGYALALLLVTAGAYALVRALRGGSRWWWAAWAAGSAASVYAHLLTALVVAGEVLVLPLLATGRRARAHAALATAAIAALALPMALFAVTTSAVQVAWIPSLRPGSFTWLARELSGAPHTLMALPAGVLMGLGLLAASKRLRGVRPGRPWQSVGPSMPDRRTVAALLVVTWAGFPVAAAAVISLVRPVFVPRYFIVVLPAFVLLVAAGVTQLRQRPRLMLAAVAAVAAMGAPTVAGLYEAEGRQDWRAAVATIADGWEPRDAVYIEPAHVLSPLDYYAGRTMAARHTPVTVYGGPRHSVSDGRPKVVRYRDATAGGIAAARLWYLSVAGEDAYERLRSSRLPPLAGVAGTWTLERTWSFRGVALGLLVPGAAPGR